MGQHLGDLVRRQFLLERGGRLDFAHERIRDVVSESLPGPERAALHGRVAAALERTNAGDLWAVAPQLARHCREARAWDQAARYYRLAADVAVERSAYTAAERLLQESLAAAERIDRRRLRIEHVVDAHLGFERVLTPPGHLADLLEHLSQAETGARSIDDRRRLGWVATQRIFCGWWAGTRTQLSYPASGPWRLPGSWVTVPWAS